MVCGGATAAPCNPANMVLITEDSEEENDEDVKAKDLVRFLGMKDGLTASMASQVKR